MMRIVLLVPLIEDSNYKIIQEKMGISNPGQKFYMLLYKGLLAAGVQAKVVSVIKDRFRSFIKDEEFLHFYIPDRVLKQRFVRRVANEISNYIDEETVVIADAEAYWTLLIALRQKCNVVALVTDFPHHVASYSSSMARHGKIYNFLYHEYAMHKMKSIKKADAYILLTEQMTEVVGKKKPYMIMEGFTDSEMSLHNKAYARSSENPTISYLGALNGKSGIVNLIDAIKLLPDLKICLNIYGNGNLVPQIVNCGDARVHYKGVVGLEDVERIEMESDFLINPRPSQDEYNKYSFPSKTLEYMVSGTPVITTRLAGIPGEYYDYLLLLEDKSTSVMAISLKTIMSKEEKELKELGKKAQCFVMSQKNNVAQSKKIISFIQELFSNNEVIY